MERMMCPAHPQQKAQQHQPRKVDARSKERARARPLRRAIKATQPTAFTRARAARTPTPTASTRVQPVEGQRGRVCTAPHHTFLGLSASSFFAAAPAVVVFDLVVVPVAALSAHGTRRRSMWINGASSCEQAHREMLLCEGVCGQNRGVWHDTTAPRRPTEFTRVHNLRRMTRVMSIVANERHGTKHRARFSSEVSWIVRE
jgi:hypothetical protein